MNRCSGNSGIPCVRCWTLRTRGGLLSICPHRGNRRSPETLGLREVELKELQGDDADDGESAPDLTINVSERLNITGTLVSGVGDAGASVQAGDLIEEIILDAQAGRNGGNVTLSIGSNATFLLGADATIETGDGGPGGSVYGENSNTTNDDIYAYGGDGSWRRPRRIEERHHQGTNPHWWRRRWR